MQNPGEVLNGLSNAEEIQKRHPKVHVVKAFNYSFVARRAETSAVSSSEPVSEPF